MAKISGPRCLKVQRAPAFWPIARKEKRFVIRPSPGPYPLKECYPLGVLIRDVLHLVNSMRECKSVLREGKIKVDGKTRYDEHFPVGLMNVISIEAINKYYRLVPKDGILLVPIEISKEESTLKICKIRNKVTIRGNKLQYGLHDGRTIINNNINAKPYDSLLIKVPEQEVIDVIRLEEGANVIITRGQNTGKIGKVVSIKEGTFNYPKRVILNLEDRTIELDANLVMVVGKDNRIPIKVS